MSGIVWNKGERAFVDGLLGGQSAYLSPQIVPNAGGNWGLGLGTRVGGVGTTKSDALAQIIEVGTSAAHGYARATIVRDQSAGGWPAATLSGGSYVATAAQKTFSFSGAPNPNGATLWFVAGDTTVNHDNCLFGGDLSGTRTYGNGDVELVTPAYQQT